MTISGGNSGSIYLVKIQNEWTQESEFRWLIVNEAKKFQVIDKFLVIEMTNNGGGTYSTSFTVDRPGKITISSYEYLNETGVYWEFSPGKSKNPFAPKIYVLMEHILVKYSSSKNSLV